jgi:hypothetical protein
MTIQSWNDPWKLTAVGMALVIASGIVTGLVVANWGGRESDKKAVDVSQAGQRENTKDTVIAGAVGAVAGAAVGAAGGAVVAGGSGAGTGAIIGGLVGAMPTQPACTRAATRGRGNRAAGSLNMADSLDY